MAGRYPDYDWRGIAMLTQQLGQLFEPSKAKLMSQQQEHEVNMLMAKKSWDIQSEELTRLKLEYKDLTKTLDIETAAVRELGLGELAIAGMRDGANSEQTSEVYEKNDIKKLSDIQALSVQYEDMIRDKEGVLDNMVSFNEHAKGGQAWRKGSMTKKDRKGEMIDYYEAANVDGIADLSYEEGQNMIKSYIKDNYTAAEGDKDAMEITFGSGDQTESFMVNPEAIAFRAGWESGTGTGTGRGKAHKAKLDDLVSQDINKNKMVRYEDMDPTELGNLFRQTQNTISTLNDKYDEEKNPKWDGGTISEAMSYTKDGHYMLIDDATTYQGMDPNDVQAYIAAHNNTAKIARAMSSKGLPVHMPLSQYGIKQSKSMDDDFKLATAGTVNDVSDFYQKIINSDLSKKGYESTVSTLNDFLTNYESYNNRPELKMQFIKELNDWLKN